MPPAGQAPHEPALIVVADTAAALAHGGNELHRFRMRLDESGDEKCPAPAIGWGARAGRPETLIGNI